MKLRVVLSVALTILTVNAFCGKTEAKIRELHPYISFRHDYRVAQLLFTPDGSEILSKSAKDELKITETTTGRFARTLAFSGYGVNSMTISGDGTRFAIGTNTGKVELWDMDPLKLQKAFPVTKWSIYAIALSPDGRMLGCCAADGTIQLWDIESSEKLHTLGEKGNRMISMSFSDDNEWIAVLCRTGRADVWSVSKGQLVGSIDVPQGSEMGSIAFCPDIKRVAITASSGIGFWNPQNEEKIRVIELPDSINPNKIFMEKTEPGDSGPVYMPMTAISLDCKTAASVIEDGTIVIWDVETRVIQQKQFQGQISGYSGRGTEKITFSADKRLLASGNRDGTVEIYRIDK